MKRSVSIRIASLIGGLLIASSRPLVHGAEERVLSISEKDLRGAAIQKVEPEYPAVARQIRLAGDVELAIVVDADGSVEKVHVMRGNTLLTGPSIQAVRKWKFKPFGAEGQPVKATGSIKFNFQM